MFGRQSCIKTVLLWMLLSLAGLLVVKITWHRNFETEWTDTNAADKLNTSMWGIREEFVDSPGTAVFLYNRVPKCGSRSVQSVVHSLAKTSNFNRISSRVYCYGNISNQDQAAFVSEISHLKKPVFFDRHIYFVDFERFGHKQPLYLNVVRDPVERFISHYYFDHRESKSACDNYATETGAGMSEKEKNMTLEECLTVGHASCTVPLATMNQLMYLCGMDQICSTPSAEALSRAKRNVAKYYVAVGYSERLEEFFEVLEWMFPKHFPKATNIYKARMTRLKAEYKTKSKLEAKEYTKMYLRRLLHLEIDLYGYIKQHFEAKLHFVRSKKSWRQANNVFKRGLA